MTPPFTASVMQVARRMAPLSLPLLSYSRYSPPAVMWRRPTLSIPRVGHGRWALALLGLLWLGWATNAIAQTPTGITVAGGNGDGSAANQLNWAYDVAVDAFGAIYVADADNHRIQKWVPGATTGVTVAGGNGAGSAANQLNTPSGVAVDMAGAVYVADYYNHRIQKWLPGATSGITVANRFGYPYGVAVDGSGAIYIADYLYSRIEKWAPGATTGIIVAGRGARLRGQSATFTFWRSRGQGRGHLRS